MQEPVRFALARYNRFFARQSADLIEFRPGEIHLIKDQAIVLELPFQQLREVTYIHFNKHFPTWMQSLSGNALMRREARFEILHAEGFNRITLELDIEFRVPELKSVLRQMYLRGINLTEKTELGLSLFLLERAEPDEIASRIRQLRQDQIQN